MSGIRYRPPTDPPAEVLAPGGRRQLIGLTLSELTDLLQAMGEPSYRARQLFDWLYARGVTEFAAMSNLPEALRQRLATATTIGCLTAEVCQAGGHTRKFLFDLADGQKIESVTMQYGYGISACISSQVGCRMGCAFCASTLNGWVRNLSAGEMVDQLLVMGRALSAGQRIGHLVVMGSGEPLENYDALLKALRLVHEPAGLDIGYRNMTISTCGIVPAMRRLAGEGLPVTLALSLHAPTDELRSQLLPVNRIWPVAEVLAAAQEYAEVTGRRITLEYILIAGVNDAPEQARVLGRLLRGKLCHVNLIPMNPVAERPQFQRPTAERIRRFREELTKCGVTATVRREMGGEIDAACGQLRSRIHRQQLTGREVT